MMKTDSLFTLISLTAILLFSNACSGSNAETIKKEQAPNITGIEQTSPSEALLTWEGNASEGYRVFVREQNDGYYVDPSASVSSKQYSFSGLSAGKSYYFGVQALSKDSRQHSEIVYSSLYRMLSITEMAAQDTPGKIAAPSGLAARQESNTSCVLSWNGVQGASGYRVFAAEQGSGLKEAGTTSAGTLEYSFTKLATGHTYILGVQALGNSFSTASSISTLGDVKIWDLDRKPGVTVSDVESTHAYIRMTCTYSNISSQTPVHGICFNTTGNPTTDDACAPGPNIPSSKKTLQVLPCTLFEYGRTYHLRAYVKVDDEIFYSDEVTASLGEEPAPIRFDWTEMDDFDIPSGIKVYKTSTTLNGRPLNAWYAIADCSKDIELRVLSPSSASQIDKQMANAGEDCYVLINGGFFYNGHIGALVSDGKLSGEIYGSMGDIRSGAPETDKWYECNRSVVGVDESGKPGAWWWRVRNGAAWYYTTPMPTVKGEAQYYWSSYTAEEKEWKPINAISAGPMVLYDGKVIVDYTINAAQGGVGNFYYSNYEMLAYDIFDQDQRPDRTAIGYTDDGRVVLFICDGRLPGESLGADLTELGQIMKGLCCVSAMNLDGGGSTGMMVRNTHLNNWYQNGKMEYRAVYTTVGFFKKK